MSFGGHQGQDRGNRGQDRGNRGQDRGNRGQDRGNRGNDFCVIPVFEIIFQRKSLWC